jgi:hypothetical protein
MNVCTVRVHVLVTTRTCSFSFSDSMPQTIMLIAHVPFASGRSQKFSRLQTIEPLLLLKELEGEETCHYFACSQCIPSLVRCGGMDCDRPVCTGCASRCSSIGCQGFLCNRCEFLQTSSCAICQGNFCKLCTVDCQGSVGAICEQKICKDCQTSLWRNRILAAELGNIVLLSCANSILDAIPPKHSALLRLKQVQESSGPHSRSKVWQCVRCQECASTCPECEIMMKQFCVCLGCQAAEARILETLLRSEPELKFKLEKQKGQLKKKDFFVPQPSRLSSFILLTFCCSDSDSFCEEHDASWVHDCQECGEEFSDFSNLMDLGYCSYCDDYRIIQCQGCKSLERYQIDRTWLSHDKQRWHSVAM